jgi:hypothetical protein
VLINCWALGHVGQGFGRFINYNTNVGNNRMRFCSSESCTSRTRYSKASGNRGRTENASFTSRMQTLCMRQSEETKFRTVQKFRTRRVHVRDSQFTERVLVLGDLKGAKQKTGEDLLALVPHVVPVLDRDPSQDLVHRGNAYLHSTSPGPCIRSRSS